MKPFTRFAPLVALVLAAGCASTSVTARPTELGKEKIARPDRIIVHDFAATPADLPVWSAAASTYANAGTSQTPAEIETGRKLGAQIAKELVDEIQAMGMPAVQAAGQPEPRVGDIAIIGYFGSVQEGSTAERLVLGFGAGGASLKTAAEGYLMTEEGMRQLGSGEVDAGTSKGPGLIVPLVVTAATANPIGLIVSGAVKAEGEVSGRDTIEGAAQRTAKQIADHLRGRFEEQGWI
jgi:hypothetical protein